MSGGEAWELLEQVAQRVCPWGIPNDPVDPSVWDGVVAMFVLRFGRVLLERACAYGRAVVTHPGPTPRAWSVTIHSAVHLCDAADRLLYG